MQIIIRKAHQTDADAIADAVMMALGNELCSDLAGDKSMECVKQLFTQLAEMEDSQYSYRNTLIAETEDGAVAGACIGYDGELLKKLRERFFETAQTILNKDFRGMSDETTDNEFYIDTSAVFPQYIGHGIGKRLLLEKAVLGNRQTGKPIGLLVDKDNPDAKRLYLSVGFRPSGERPFAHILMDHLILPTPT